LPVAPPALVPLPPPPPDPEEPAAEPPDPICRPVPPEESQAVSQITETPTGRRHRIVESESLRCVMLADLRAREEGKYQASGTSVILQLISDTEQYAIWPILRSPHSTHILPG